MGVTLSVSIDDRQVRELLAQLDERARDLTTPMETVGKQLLFSVQQNFAVGGRPPWPPSRRALRQGGQTLVDSGRLLGSIAYRPFADRVEIGTNVLYGRAHQLGFFGTVTVSEHARLLTGAGFSRRLTLSTRTKSGRKQTRGRIGTFVRVKSHTRQMRLPARPFLAVQDEDRQLAARTILDYLLSRRGGA